MSDDIAQKVETEYDHEESEESIAESSEDEYLPPGKTNKRKAKQVKVTSKKTKNVDLQVTKSKDQKKNVVVNEPKRLEKSVEMKPPTLAKSVLDSKFHFNLLKNNRPGSDVFMDSFIKIEEQLVGGGNKTSVVETDDATMETLDKLFNDEGKVIITSDLGKLGFKMPKDFSFDRANELIGTNKTKIEVIDSRSGDTLSSTVGEVFTTIYTGKNTDKIPNVLSFEVTKDEILGPMITIPTFVKQNSLVCEIDEAFGTLARESNSSNKFRLTGAERNKQKQLRDEHEKYSRIVPRYDKYIIFSQAGAYTCLHVDLAGSAVYYYVVQGQKIIYLAEPTKENLELYRKLELEKKNIWSCDEDVIRKFERRVVDEKKMVIIPPGYLHFVYTPVKSLVIGGNYVTRRFLPLHMKMTQLEEKCLKIKNLSRNQMFINFYEILYAWLKHVYLPYLDASPHVGRYKYMKDMGLTLLHGLEVKKESGPLYDFSEKNKLLTKLKDVLHLTREEKEQCAEAVKTKNNADAIDFGYIKLAVN